LHVQGKVLLASTGFTLSLVVCPQWSAIGDKNSEDSASEEKYECCAQCQEVSPVKVSG